MRKRATQMKQQAKHLSRNMKTKEMTTAKTSERRSHFQFYFIRKVRSEHR